MTGLSKIPAQQTELILRLLSIWRIVFSLLAVVGAFAPWVGLLPGLRLWQGIVLSIVLGLAAVFSFIASRDILLRHHRGRTISLFVDYLSLVACLVILLQVGGVFTGIDALGDVFGRSVLFLLVAFGGYLISAAGDYFQHAPKIENILRQAGKWVMILGGRAFL